MLAVNIGGSLLRDRSLFRIVLLRNDTDLAFITGDQPVINVNDERDFKGVPVEIELYCPLSPKLAMWFVLASKAPKELTKDVIIYVRRGAEHAGIRSGPSWSRRRESDPE